MILAPLLSFAFAALARADSPENPSILAVDQSLGVSYQDTSLYYIENSGRDAFTSGQDYDDYEKGSIGGGKIEASWMFPEMADLYLHGEWSGVKGQVQYTGFSQNLTSSIYGPSNAVIQNWGLKIGKGVVTGERWMLTPYVSFGGRHWERTLSPGTPFVFVESYDHRFAALGGLVQYAPFFGWTVTADASAGRTFSASLDSPKDLGFDHQRLGASPLLRLGLEVDSRIASMLHTFIGFGYQYFSYGQSGVVVNKIVGAAFEPTSHTAETQLNFGARLSFSAAALTGDAPGCKICF